MPVQDSFIALGASMLAVWLWSILVVLFWFVLFILMLGFGRLGFRLVFCLSLGAGSGCGADTLLPVLLWLGFFFVWLAWGGRFGCRLTIPVWALVDLPG